MANVPKGMVASAPAIALPGSLPGRERDDRELVRLSQSGTAEAFEELVRRHQQRVFALVGGILRRSEDVEDVAQQVFFKAYLGIRRFDQRAAFSTWLYKIAVNECWDHLRKKKVRPLVYEADLSEEQVSRLDGIVSASRPPEGPSDRAEAREILDRILATLPEQDRQLLVLKEMAGFSVQELAEILKLNVNTVKVRLFRARGRIMDVYRRRMGTAGKTGAASAAQRKE
ncbi:MAG TPA: sigma-70 family RNA polymerase sigma factor [Candidatus Polarisedimenticolia bacterium]|jgi:RNA polymerase sigma-70 factor (ECF subfamily)|nr:sigma-70 family RNA polymerase sigma factor [Candidatus Polarisedimenticolia bacterium]